MAGRATQERTLGAILGMGIGDALGMPVIGRAPGEIATEFGKIDTYHGRSFPDGAELAPGEFTDETEIALCVMETYTSANGELDPELIRARMQFLARGESRRWMSPETLRSLSDDPEPWFRSSDTADPEVALRGIPIGLIHAAPKIDPDRIKEDVGTVVSLTHSAPGPLEQATLVAMSLALTLSGASRQDTLLSDLIEHEESHELTMALKKTRGAVNSHSDFDVLADGIRTGNAAIDVILTGLAAFVRSEQFEDAVFTAASLGGASDSRAAFAGALAGAHFGAGGIPQRLIDQLEGRIYLTLAAPWFYRTIQLMTGRGISLGVNGH